MSSIRKNTLYNLMGSIIPIIATLFTVPIYLSLIGVERYGTLTILWALMGYFGFMDLGLGKAVAQRLAAEGHRSAYGRSRLVWTSITMASVLGVLAGFLLWLFADYILTAWIEMSPQNLAEAKLAVPWFVVAMPLILNASILTGVLHGRQNFLAMNVLSTSGSVMAQLFPLAVALYGYEGLDWLVPAALSARLITLLINFQYCRRRLPLRMMPHVDLSYVRSLFSYGGWVSVISIVGPILTTLDRVIIGTIAGAKGVAFYTIPFSIVTRLMVLPGSLNSTLFPRFSSLSKQESLSLIDKSNHFLLSVMTIITIPCIALVHPFLTVWVGDEFATQANGVGEVILLGVLFNSVAHSSHAYLMGIGKPKVISIIYLVQLPVYLPLLWLGLNYLGVFGAALAWSVGVLLDTLLLLWASSRLKETIYSCMFPFLLCSVMVFVSLALPVNAPMRWYFTGLLVFLSLLQGRAVLSLAFDELQKKIRGNTLGVINK